MGNRIGDVFKNLKEKKNKGFEKINEQEEPLDGYEEASDLLEEVLEVFENQYNVELRSTGYYEEDGELIEDEYWIEGLGDSPLIEDLLEFRIGGRFELNKRERWDPVSCFFELYIEGEKVPTGKAIFGIYSLERGRWDLNYEEK